MRRSLVQSWRRRDEEGAFLVVWVLLLLGLLTMVAIVIDLAQLRQDRRQQRLAADAGVTAGGLTLTKTAAGRLGACEDAWTYAAENLGFGPTPPPSPCGSAITGDCDNTTPATQSAVGSLGSYTVRITTPVINGDALMSADAAGGDVSQPANSSTGVNDSDGKPCERIAVRITNVRTSTFGQVVGFDNNTTDVHSVGRSATDDGNLYPNLVVLEPHECNAILANGTPAIEVVGTTSLRGGIVIVDDGAACSGTNNWVLNVGSGNSKGHVTAAVNGDIYMKAGNGVCTGTACDPGQLDVSTCWNLDPDLTTCKGYYPEVRPLPVTINRSRIDYLYNCRAGYTTTTGNYRNVTIDGTTMAGCPNTTADYMNKLYNQVVNLQGLRPTSPTVIGTNPSQACPVLSSPVAGPVEFNCELGNITLVVNGDAWFRQSSALSPVSLTVNGNAVFDGPVDLGTNNLLEVAGNSYFASDLKVTGSTAVVRLHGALGTYPSTCQGADFITNIATCVKRSGYVAGAPSTGAAFSFIMGNFVQNGGTTSFDRVLVYGGPSGRLNRAGGGNLVWSGPSKTSGSPFTKLSFWSDTTLTHEMGGGGDLEVEGVFFAPDAVYELGGNSPTIPLDAQFWAKKLHGAGTSVFRMTPDPDLISVPTGPVVRLIR
ncbi:MAG: pilus assembly protein TadG-related protein [Actinomycetota bacterium]|nr:pilus assembly protein TadG-related protein [Actinomycetota bacterium]